MQMMIAQGAPFFVLGNPRSGTTLLRLALTAHPALVVPPEAGFICWLHDQFGAWGGEQWANVELVRRFVDHVAGTRKFSTWNIGAAELMPYLATRKPATYSEACSAIYEAYVLRTKPGASRWGDKNNYYTGHVDLLAMLYPLAQFIHIVRDPRDVACSYRDTAGLDRSNPFRPDLPTDATMIAVDWSANVTNVRHGFSRIDSDRCYTLRYEDLVTDPGRQLAALCVWLNVPFTIDMLAFWRLNRDKELEPKAMLGWKKKTLEPITASQVCRFRSELQEQDQRVIETVAASMMVAYGYLPS